MISPKYNAMWYLNLAISFHKCREKEKAQNADNAAVAVAESKIQIWIGISHLPSPISQSRAYVNTSLARDDKSITKEPFFSLIHNSILDPNRPLDQYYSTSLQ